MGGWWKVWIWEEVVLVEDWEGEVVGKCKWWVVLIWCWVG